MRKWIALMLLIAAAASPAGTVKPVPPIEFTETRLDNGLRVILSEDHYAPVYAIFVAYGVGAKDERPGRTGFAHLFEHMMFKGSANVGPGEHFYLIYTNGGTMNGATSADMTVYFETLPKNQLDLGLFLEADRMRSLALNAANFENQRDTVMEERRQSVDNQAYGRTTERLLELAYDCFAYKHPVIGYMEDLKAATLEDAKEFYRTYYAPNNAVLALVGDFDSREALAKIKKYFGDIPRQAPPKPVDFSEPPRNEERRDRIVDRLARLARLDVAYKIPPGTSPDIDALEVMHTILASGESSRLFQRLVRKEQVAASVGGTVDDRVGPGLYRLVITVQAGRTPEEAEKVMDEEIARLIREGVTEKEMARARAAARRSVASMRTSVLSRARSLAVDALLFNEPGRINTLEKRISAVTADQVRQVAARYLRRENRVVVITVPEAAGAGKAGQTGAGVQ